MNNIGASCLSNFFCQPEENVFLSACRQDYYSVYAACRLVVANRVHGAICAAGFGVPSIVMGDDTRILTSEYVGIPHFCTHGLTWDDVADVVTDMLDNRVKWHDDLIEKRDNALSSYISLLDPIVKSVSARLKDAKEKQQGRQNLLRLSKVEELETAGFRDFMQRMNRFAHCWNLREFTNWSKIWEYPWIWYNAIAQRDWKECRVVDLGSEKSPMPWILALMGAKVTMIEVDQSWLPLWETLKAKLCVDIDWHFVDSELIPVTDSSVDLVTSFSVVEHQPNKQRAVDEIVRILKPSGCLAISFDICEEELGMTFPEWNGKALTMKEFDQLFWTHPAFNNGQTIHWNMEDMRPYWDWHKETASHHNYVTAGAVLYKNQ